jgi:hypothetical protein
MIMTLAKEAGLADSTAQLYMVFYCIGPALLGLTLVSPNRASWPSRTMVAKSFAIAIIDIGAQAMNYTGASLAGPTLFSIVSVFHVNFPFPKT